MQVQGNLHPESLATCPYNPSHRIIRHRMQRHLVSCKKNAPDSPMVNCPFNAVHRIPEPELAYHAATCPDKFSLDHFTYTPERGSDNCLETNIPIAADVYVEECWDDDAVPKYEPKVLDKNILRQLNNESKGKRKEFRCMERIRLQRVNEEIKNKQSFEELYDDTNSPKHRSAAISTSLAKTKTLKNLEEEDPYNVEEMIRVINEEKGKTKPSPSVMFGKMARDVEKPPVKKRETDDVKSETKSVYDIVEDDEFNGSDIESFPALPRTRFGGNGSRNSPSNISRGGRGRKRF